jgi:uridine phosphorylase
MIPESKICTKCKVEKSQVEFRIRTKKYKSKVYTYLNPSCKKCEGTQNAEILRNNPERTAKKKLYHQTWVSENKDYYLEQKRIQSKERSKKYPQFHKRWRDNNRIKMTNHSRSVSKFARENLLDYYIVGYLVQSTNLTTEQVRQQPELIELTRKIIQIKRKIENAKSNELSATC